MLGNALVLAIREIRRNLLRAFLTGLGIVIGVAAVITMVTLGSGATAQVTAQIATMGSNLLMVHPGQRLGPGQQAGAPAFSEEDAAAITRDIGALQAVAPTASKGVTAIYGNANWSTNVVGSTNDYFTAGNWAIEQGRSFTQGELRSGKAACVIGATVRRELFGAQDPVGGKLRLNKLSCEVVGVLRAKGQSAMGRDQDDTIIVPLRTLQRRIAGHQDVNQILVSMQNGASTASVQQAIEQLLRQRRHLAANETNNFNVLDTRQIAQTLTGTTRVLTLLLGAVAAVSLLVGGIGIMNIMLVSVTERTREIGIRLAIGALEWEVLLQFLVEAVVLSTLGGSIGIVLALGASWAVADLMRVPFLFNPVIVTVAFLFSAAVGVLFGYFPARRAASLDPIDALRHE
ncbi:MAG: ABC transporter permease [Gammaproteobacteria bacterium]